MKPCPEQRQPRLLEASEASATVLFPPAKESDRDPARASTVHLPAMEKQSQNELPNRPAEQC
jgi:hypothetical protein